MTAAWREDTANGGDVLVRRGRLSDLIFVTRPDESTPTAPILETALLETGRPVMVVPALLQQQCAASRITIGWNASAEAARAVAAAALIINAEVGTLLRANLQSRAQDFDPLSRDRLLAGLLMPAGPDDVRLEPGYTGGESAADADPAEESLARAVVAELGLVGSEHAVLRRQYAVSGSLTGCGTAVVTVLEQLSTACGLESRVLAAGHLAGLWGPPWLCEIHSGHRFSPLSSEGRWRRGPPSVRS